MVELSGKLILVFIPDSKSEAVTSPARATNADTGARGATRRPT
jgi:hypothetical protein